MTDRHDDECECCAGKLDPTEFYRQIAENIEDSGQHVMGVFGEGRILPFTYTIGNTGQGLPELLLVGGFSFGDGAVILNRLGCAMRERGRPFDDGEIVNWGGRLPVKVINAGDEARDEYVIQASRCYPSDLVTLQQVLVPDTDGRFPGEPGCAEPYAMVPRLVETKLTKH